MEQNENESDIYHILQKVGKAISKMLNPKVRVFKAMLESFVIYGFSLKTKKESTGSINPVLKTVFGVALLDKIST